MLHNLYGGCFSYIFFKLLAYFCIVGKTFKEQTKIEVQLESRKSRLFFVSRPKRNGSLKRTGIPTTFVRPESTDTAAKGATRLLKLYSWTVGKITRRAHVLSVAEFRVILTCNLPTYQHFPLPKTFSRIRPQKYFDHTI